MEVFQMFSIDFDWFLLFCNGMKISKMTYEMINARMAILRYTSLSMFDSNTSAVDEPSKIIFLVSVVQALN
jgi:hypothetical protein